MTRDELVRWIAGVIAMGLLTLVVDVIADLIRAGTTEPVKAKLKAAAMSATGIV